jgi:hypothetical protein
VEVRCGWSCGSCRRCIADARERQDRYVVPEFCVLQIRKLIRYPAADGFDEFGNAISNLPENAAHFAGEAVGGVENFGESVYDNVTEFPENAAHWAGEKVEGVEQTWDGAVEGVEDFGGRMGDAYDDGREDARDDDDDGGW